MKFKLGERILLTLDSYSRVHVNDLYEKMETMGYEGGRERYDSAISRLIAEGMILDKSHSAINGVTLIAPLVDPGYEDI